MTKNLLIFLFPLFLLGCTESPVSPVAWWKSINDKAAHLASLEVKYDTLKKDYEKLQIEFYQTEHKLVALQAEVQSKETANLSLKLTGSKEGRAIASIHYELPKGISPKAMLDLAYEHLREERFQEAAVTFEAFIALPESASMPLTDVFYSAGVAWYQVQNYKKARENFETANQHVEGDEKEKVHKKVELWMRAIDRKLASSELLDHSDHKE